MCLQVLDEKKLGTVQYKGITVLIRDCKALTHTDPGVNPIRGVASLNIKIKVSCAGLYHNELGSSRT